MLKENRTPAIAYLRTSSATNVGADKDSDKRQREAIASFARRAGYELVGVAATRVDVCSTPGSCLTLMGLSEGRLCAKSGPEHAQQGP